jgi:insertion element IS1 protein InsB
MEESNKKEKKEKKIVKRGFTKRCKQIYYDKDTKKYFIKEEDKKRKGEKDKVLAIKMKNEGISDSKIAKVLGVCSMTIGRWLKQVMGNMPSLDNSHISELTFVEIDELYTYVGKKKEKMYIWIMLDRYTMMIVDYHVSLKKKFEEFSELMSKVSHINIEYAATDGALHYKLLDKFTNIKHEVTKSLTTHVESFNNLLRCYIPELGRKSHCYFKNYESALLKINYFLYIYNSRQTLKAIKC